jgi:hypothetical protein
VLYDCRVGAGQGGSECHVTAEWALVREGVSAM